MSKQGAYDVQSGGVKDTSFKSFICALLVFLALCIIIYLALVLGRNGSKKDEYPKEAETFEETNYKSEKDRLTAINGPNDNEENGYTTTRRSTSKRKTTTPRRKTTTKSYKDEENTIPEFIDETEKNLLAKLTTPSTTVTHAHTTTSRKTTTPRSFREEANTTSQYKDEKDKYVSDKYEPTTRPTIIDEETSDLMRHDITTNPITPKESTTLNLGIDHEIFHGYSSTGSSEDSTTEKLAQDYETTSEMIEDSEKINLTTLKTISSTSENVIVNREENTEENESSTETSDIQSVLTTTEGLLPTTDNFQSSTESSMSITVVNRGRNIPDESLSTTEVTSITEGESPQSENHESNTESSLNDDLQNNTTESLNSQTTSHYTSHILQSNNTENMTEKNNSAEFLMTTDVTEVDDDISPTEDPQIIRKSTTSHANLKLKSHPESTTTIEMQTTLSTTTVHPGTTHMSIVRTAGIPKKHLQVKQCESEICKKVTSKMVNMMNHATDPCDNFYEFACSGQEFDDNYNLEEMNFETLLFYMNKVNASSEKYLRVFQRFYKTCVEHEKNFNFTNRMEFVGYFPEYNLTELFVDLLLSQSMPLFDVGLDIGGNQEYKLQLTLHGCSSLRATVNGWSISDQIRDECLSEQRHLTLSSVVSLDEVYDAFRNCQRRRFKIAATNFVDNMKPFIKDPTTTIFRDANLVKMLKLLDAVQDMLPTENEMQEAKLNRKFVPISIEELNKAYNVVDWRTILEKITFNSTFSENDFVDVYFSSIILDILTNLHYYTERELVEILGLYSAFQLYENTVIPKRMENREKFCMKLSRQLMPDVVSTIIYDMAHHDKQLHIQNVKITMLFNNLVDQFKDSLSNSKLDDTSKNSLLHKLGRIKLGLITTGNYNATRKNYLRVGLGDNYQGNVIQLINNYRSTIYSLERTKASASNLLIYFVDHFSTQPRSFYPSEYIVFHPAVFQRASLLIPKYLQLSKMGLHLSRELMRHFDPVGRKFLTDSQISSSDNYYNYLVNRTAELLVLYANSTYNFQGKTLNFKITGNMLINEMIADNAALKLIYDLFAPLKNQENLPWIYHSYPIEKVFFITAAQEYCKRTTALNFMEDIYETGHLPSPLKIQNIVSNSKEFAEAFECVEGSAMMLYEDLITQFPYINFEEDDYHTDPQFFN